jgi:hypothetical protein
MKTALRHQFGCLPEPRLIRKIRCGDFCVWESPALSRARKDISLVCQSRRRELAGLSDEMF